MMIPSSVEPRYNILPELYVALTAALGGLSFGIVISFPSPALPSMREDSNFVNLTEGNISWMASMAPLAALFATPFTGMGIKCCCRKSLMFGLSVPLLLGWLLIGFANGVTMVYAGRFFTGFAISGFSTVPIVYINETASKEFRGRLASLQLIAIHTGILVPFLLGSLTYRWQALSVSLVPIVMVLMLIFVPESPRFLLTRGQEEEAAEALTWLRRGKTKTQIQQELSQIKIHLEVTEKQNVGVWNVVTEPGIVKPTCTCICLMLLQAMTGIDAILSFKYQIFEASGSSVSPNLGSIIVGGVQVVAVVVAGTLMDRFGRRLLLLISEVVCALSLFSLGLSFHLLSSKPEFSSSFGWLPLVSLIVFEIGFSLGIGPIPWIYLEVLPTNLIGLISGMVVASHWVAVFLVTQSFQTLQTAIGGDWCFWGFSAFAVIGWFFAFFVVRETKGTTLEELHQRFKSGNKA